MRPVVLIGVLIAGFFLGDILFNHGQISSDIQRSFERTMTGWLH